MASKVAKIAREVFLNDAELTKLVESGLKKYPYKFQVVSWLLILLEDEVIPTTTSKYTKSTLEYVVAGFSKG